MKSIELIETRKTSIVDLPIPGIGASEILIKTAYAGICGSDLHAFEGRHPFRKPPVILGHEISGIVESVGSEVTDFASGDAVTVMPYIACGDCVPCRSGQPNICANRVVPGIGGWLGTFADYFVSRPEITFRLDSPEELRLGALTEPLAVGVHSVVRGRVRPGDTVLILGGGTIGLLTAISAVWVGAEHPVVTDVMQYNLDMCRDIVDAVPVDAREPEMVRRLLKQYPDGFDVVLMCSGVSVNVDEAVALVRRGGRIVVTGMYMQSVKVSFLDFTLRELDVLGSQIYVSEDFDTALEIIRSGRFPMDKIITGTVGMHGVQATLSSIADGNIKSIKMLIDPTLI